MTQTHLEEPTELAVADSPRRSKRAAKSPSQSNTAASTATASKRKLEKDQSDTEKAVKVKKTTKKVVDDAEKKTGETKTKAAKTKTKKTVADPIAAELTGPTNTTMPTTYDIAPLPSDRTKIVSWNVCSLRASLKKGFKEYVKAEDATILCLQETKLQDSLGDLFSEEEYPFQYWTHSTAKKGYAGSAVFSKLEPISVTYGIGKEEMDREGRVITLEFAQFYLVAAYVINAGNGLVRLGYKREWNATLQSYLKELDAKRPVIFTGDLNVAHTEIDLSRPKTNAKTAGFTPEERQDFSTLLKELDMVDTFRELHPTTTGAYTYYSHRFACRSKRLGWRLDYNVCSRRLLADVEESFIRDEAYGASDHVPIVIVLRKKSESTSN